MEVEIEVKVITRLPGVRLAVVLTCSCGGEFRRIKSMGWDFTTAIWRCVECKAEAELVEKE